MCRFMIINITTVLRNVKNYGSLNLLNYSYKVQL